MSQIRIYLDGTYESLSAAKPKTAQDHKARVSELKKDLALATKISKQQTALEKIREAQSRLKEAAKTTTNVRKAEALQKKALVARAVIKNLKGQLSSIRHAKLEVIERVLAAADNAKSLHADGAKVAKQKAANKVKQSPTNAQRTENENKKEHLQKRIDMLQERIVNTNDHTKRTTLQGHQAQLQKQLDALKPRSTNSKVTRGNKTGDPRRNPTRLKSLRSKAGNEQEVKQQKREAELDEDHEEERPGRHDGVKHARNYEKVQGLHDQLEDLEKSIKKEKDSAARLKLKEKRGKIVDRLVKLQEY